MEHALVIPEYLEGRILQVMNDEDLTMRAAVRKVFIAGLERLHEMSDDMILAYRYEAERAREMVGNVPDALGRTEGAVKNRQARKDAIAPAWGDGITFRQLQRMTHATLEDVVEACLGTSARKYARVLADLEEEMLAHEGPISVNKFGTKHGGNLRRSVMKIADAHGVERERRKQGDWSVKSGAQKRREAKLSSLHAA